MENRNVLGVDNSEAYGAALCIISVRGTAQLNLPPVNQTHCPLKGNKATLSIQC